MDVISYNLGTWSSVSVTMNWQSLSFPVKVGIVQSTGMSPVNKTPQTKRKMTSPV